MTQTMRLLEKAVLEYRRRGLLEILKKAIREPSLIVQFPSYIPYSMYNVEPPIPNSEFHSFVSQLLDDATEDETKCFRGEIREDSRFTDAITEQFQMTTARPDRLHENWRELLYVLVRYTEPDQLVEAGVYDGLASAYLLAGLEKNGRGTLVSIDINQENTYPPDIPNSQCGWVVPEYLTGRWNLRIGDSLDLLSEIARSRNIDFFLSDTKNTTEMTKAEFSSVEGALRTGSVVLRCEPRPTDFDTHLGVRIKNAAHFQKDETGGMLSGGLVE